jgi:hypothetical protein
LVAATQAGKGAGRTDCGGLILWATGFGGNGGLAIPMGGGGRMGGFEGMG